MTHAVPSALTRAADTIISDFATRMLKRFYAKVSPAKQSDYWLAIRRWIASSSRRTPLRTFVASRLRRKSPSRVEYRTTEELDAQVCDADDATPDDPILARVAQGYTYREISRQLGQSPATVARRVAELRRAGR